jgi:hypothetical protein
VSQTPRAELPVGNRPAPVALPHFPDALHAVIWRNWELVPVERLAQVLGATPHQIEEIARSMGLPEALPISPEAWRRSYITVIRRNWHLLPYDQLLELLGWTAEELAYTLREDDFLYFKLGGHKPQCPPVRYAPPGAAARRRADQIRYIMEETLGEAWTVPMEPRFAFVQALSEPEEAPAPPEPESAGERFPLRFLYSYFALYGDPLLNPELDPYPDGYLARLAGLGVNGVWLQGVLHTLAPWAPHPELSEGYAVRLANLNRLVERAGKHGIGVYLYLNEPRAMPLSFFEAHPDWRGVVEGEYAALCTSVSAIQDFLRDSLTFLFQQVPSLAGVFTISMSENLSHCWSHGRGADCPRCGVRSPAEVVAEVNRLVAEGVHRAQPQARVIVWDWGWGEDWAPEAIAQLPPGVSLMSVSEWSLPIRRGGVASTVGEYSLSAVGPGPRATRHWAAARQAGLHPLAKVQVNNSWELSAVPYLPCLDLVAEHLYRLAQADVEGLMLGWTLGGYPSPNLEVAAQFYRRDGVTPAASLAAVAERRYGPDLAPVVRQAWTACSRAFQEFPYHAGVVYQAPLQMGPANLLFEAPTGFSATMVGFPYDDLDGWRAIYPPEVFAGQMEKVAAGWGDALQTLQAAQPSPNSPWQASFEDLRRVTEAAYWHFRSVAQQARFVLARRRLTETADPTERAQLLDSLEALLNDEIAAAQRLFHLVTVDSRIGFEATNHYFYTRLDLAEKILNCLDLRDRWLAAWKSPRINPGQQNARGPGRPPGR